MGDDVSDIRDALARIEKDIADVKLLAASVRDELAPTIDQIKASPVLKMLGVKL